MKIVFFKTPRPKQFSYPPRYYDPEQERVERRRKELGLSNSDKSDFRSQVQSSWKQFRSTDRSRKRKSETSVLIYLFIAAILLYFIFFT